MEVLFMKNQSGLRLVSIVVAFSALFFVNANAQARAPQVYMGGGFLSSGWEYAVDGFDVIAYFDLAADAKPVRGNDAFVTEYKGVKWRFATQENLDTFIANPSRYAPRYGGYCAWAVAENKLAKGHPSHWYVHDGKLYLNVSAGIKRKWLSDLEGYLQKSEANWPAVFDTK